VEDAQSLPLFDEGVAAVYEDTPVHFREPSEAAPEDLTDKEFKGLLRKALIPVGSIAPAAKRLFPDVKSSADLTDAQRGQLWIVLATEQGQ
jgi:hypothetical protein